MIPSPCHSTLKRPGVRKACALQCQYEGTSYIHPVQILLFILVLLNFQRFPQKWPSMMSQYPFHTFENRSGLSTYLKNLTWDIGTQKSDLNR